MQDLHSSAFNSASNYANAVMFVGYAGIFAIWGMTKDNIDHVLSGFVGILLIISIASFVTFEIYKMIKIMRPQIEFVQKVHRDNSPDNVISALDILKRKEKIVHQSMMQVWFLCFLVSVCTGYFSGFLLFCALLQTLINV